MITLLLPLKDQAIIERLQYELSMKLKVSMVNAMGICTSVVTGWELNLDHVLYSKFWLVPFYLISLLRGCTTNVTMGKTQWMVSEEHVVFQKMWYFKKLSRAKWPYICCRSFLKHLHLHLHLYLQFMLLTCEKAKTLSNLKESKVQERSRKPLKYTNWNERSTQMLICTSIFKRLPMARILFIYNGMDDVICGH